MRRIWPVIVTAGNLTQSDPFWRYVDSASRGRLAQAGVQPLTILDVGDFEALRGLVEAGHALHDVLAAKTQVPYRNFELAIWLRHDPRAPMDVTGRPTYVERVWERAVQRMSAMTDFTKGIQPPRQRAVKQA